MDGFLPIRLHGQGSPDSIDGLGSHDRFLRNVDREEQLISTQDNGLLKNGDLIHVGPFVAPVPGVPEKGGVGVESLSDLHNFYPGVLAEKLQGFIHLYSPLRSRQNAYDMALGGGHVSENTGRFEAADDSHQVFGL